MRLRRRIFVEVALLSALLIGLNLVGARHFWRGDATRTHLYGLSPRGAQFLRALGSPVELTAFVLRGAPGSSELRGDLDDLFQRMERASAEVHARVVDAEREPEATRILAARYHLTGDQLADGVVVVAAPVADQWKVVEASALAELALSPDGESPPKLRAWRGEAALLDAVVAVTQSRRASVCLTSGHGEPTFSEAEVRGGWSGFVDLLRRDQLEPRSAAVSDLHGCDLVIVGSPELSWTPAEVTTLTHFLDGSGRLLLLLGPSFDAASARFVTTGLEPLLARFGIGLGENFVLDRPSAGSDLRFYVDQCGGPPVGAWLANRRLLFDDARSLTLTNVAGIHAGRLCQSSGSAWGEHDILSVAAHTAAPDPTDEAGPLNLGISARDEHGARLVVWGSSEIAGDLALAANQPLLLGSVDWLLDRPLGFDVPGRAIEETRLALDDAQRARLLLLLVGVLPLLALLAGGFVYIKRRH